MEQTGKQHEAANFKNIIVLSLAFMLLMGAWFTTAGMEQAILYSIHTDDSNFTGNGFISQSIVNGVFAVTNFIAPAIVSFAGVRTSMIVGSSAYALFTANFLYPSVYLLYGTSALIGFTASSVWIACGVYLTRCTTKQNIGKYMNMYWSIMSLGQLGGNAFLFWRFQGLNHIDHDTRFQVVSILTCCSALATVTFCFLGKAPIPENSEGGKLDNKNANLCTSLTQTLRLIGNKHILLLTPCILYNGIELAFLTAIYPTSVAFSEAFGGDTRKLLGLAGLIIGAGSLTGGLCGILVSKKLKSARKVIVTYCCLGHLTCFVLIYFNLPNAAPLGPTLDTSWINPPSIYLAMFCAFLFGFGDGSISPQMCAAISVIWQSDPSSALAIYRTILAIACAGSYYVSTLTGLYNQIIIFAVAAVVGTFAFHVNERLIAECDEGLVMRAPKSRKKCDV